MPTSYDQPEQKMNDNDAADQTARVLRILPLRLTLQSRSLSLSFFSGPLWRSGFGLALKTHFPGIYDLLFADQARLGRLYALQPPFRAVHSEDVFDLGLSLFGPACDYAVACAQAIAHLGEMGLGSKKGKYILVEASVAGGGTPPFFTIASGLIEQPAAVPPQSWLEPFPGNVRELHLDLLTPLRIKKDNEPLLAPPEFSLLVRRLHGRMAQLCEAAGERVPISRSVSNKQIELATSIRLHDSKLSHTEVKRRSTRTGETMYIEGMTGSLCFRGDLAPFIGLFSLGSILNLGGKSAFGFGCFSIRITPES